jgi:hypothetical protein
MLDVKNKERWVRGTAFEKHEVRLFFDLTAVKARQFFKSQRIMRKKKSATIRSIRVIGVPLGGRCRRREQMAPHEFKVWDSTVIVVCNSPESLIKHSFG